MNMSGIPKEVLQWQVGALECLPPKYNSSSAHIMSAALIAPGRSPLDVSKKTDLRVKFS